MPVPSGTVMLPWKGPATHGPVPRGEDDTMGARSQTFRDHTAMLPIRLAGEPIGLIPDSTDGLPCREHLAVPTPALPTLDHSTSIDLEVGTVAGDLARWLAIQAASVFGARSDSAVRP